MVVALTPPTTRYVFADRAVAMLNDVVGEIRGYVAIWGDIHTLDAYGTYFDKARVPEMGIDLGMHQRPIMYEHAQDGVLRKEIVAHITDVGFDDVGIWYRGFLDRSSPFFGRIVDELLSGELKTSSATMDHTGDFYDDGAFKTWILGELSLTKYPAEKRMPASVLVRSHEGEHDAARDNGTPLSIATPLLLKRRTRNMEELQVLIDQLLGQGMTLEEILAFVQQRIAAAAPVVDAVPAADPAAAPVAPLSAPNLLNDLRSLISERQRSLANQNLQQQVTQIQQTMETFIRSQQERDQAERNAPPAPATAPRGHVPPTPITNVRDLRYDHMSASDALFAAKMLNDYNIAASEEFVRAVSHKVVDAASNGSMFRHDKTTGKVGRFVRSRGVEGVQALLNEDRSPMFRADEIMATDSGAGKGQDWVGTFYSSDLWDFIRVRPIMEQLISRGMKEVDIPAGAKTVVVPTKGADPVIYASVEANDIVDNAKRPEATAQPTYQGTGSVTVSANELRAVVYRTLRLEETAIVNVASELNAAMQLAFAEAQEYVVINGDTATSLNTNLNLIDGTPASSPQRPKYLVTDGMIKSPLITTTAYARDNGALALTDQDWLTTVGLLPAELIANMTEALAFIVDTRTWLKALQLAALKTADVAGNAATLVNGELKAIWGIPVLKSGQMALANTAGKISATPGNNTRGRILVVAPRYWQAFYGRGLTIETGRHVEQSVTVVAAHMVMGVAKRSTDGAAIAYNVAV